MPLEAPPEALALQPNLTNPNRRTMMAMVTALDTGVGKVVDTLSDAGMYDNSIIVLTTDNGGATNSGKYLDAGNNWPLRGSKCTEWQGGVRGVAMISSPLLNAAVRNTSWAGMMHVVDWYPTVAAMAQLPASSMAGTGPVDVDGISVWSAVQEGHPSPRTEMVHNIDGVDEKGAWSGSIRVGDLKMMVGFPGYPDGHVRPAGGGPGALSGWDMPEHAECDDCTPLDSDFKACVAQPCLFNISADPCVASPLVVLIALVLIARPLWVVVLVLCVYAERACHNMACVSLSRYEYHDIAGEQPALLAKMQAKYDGYKKTAVGKRDTYGICPPAPPGGWPDACAANKAVGYWEPWVTDYRPPPPPHRFSTTDLVIGGLVAAGAVVVVACAAKVVCCSRPRKEQGRELYEPISSSS